jgi:DNA ligase-1
MTNQLFKPMLATAIEDTSTLKFPVLASIKLDGIRCTMQNGMLLSRTLKPIPNKNVQKMFARLPEGIDGELIYGDPGHKDCYRTTTSIVMSHDKQAAGVKFYAFDIFEQQPFSVRTQDTYTLVFDLDDENVEQVHQKDIFNEEQLLEYEATALEAGHEGVMVRSLNGPYKQGRSSLREGYLLKLKRFKDAEAKIVGFYEEQENTNEAKTNELGRTYRSSAKEGMVGKGNLGGFEVQDLVTGIDFQIGGGFDASMRKEFWKDRKKLIGKIVKYKYFPSGSKTKPRFPVWIGWRDPIDL